MKAVFLFGFLFLLTTFLSAQIHHCGTVQPLDDMSMSGGLDQAQNRELITISVIFHVVWQEAEENIEDSQIYSQLEVLNEDYRALNNQSNVPTGFQNRIADSEIEFCLAQRLPNGQATSGIMRYQTDEELIGLKQVLYTTAPAIDSEHYLNVWVADLGGGLNGQATFPGTAAPEQDGVIIDPHFVGTTGLAANAQPYHLGRTLTHEVGHYLNLYHVFGTTTGGSCTTDDFVEDTPNSELTYLGQCPTGIEFSCNNSDMWMNFMYFTDDACLSMFSEGQKMRMRATLDSERSGLKNSEGCLPVNIESIAHSDLRIYPNPASSFLFFECLENEVENVKIFDARGVEVLSFEKINTRSGFNISNLETGIYFVTFTQMSSLITGRFIKN